MLKVNCHPEGILAILNLNLDDKMSAKYVAQRLQKNKTWVNEHGIQDVFHQVTPLLEFSALGYIATVQIILDAGADVDAADNFGRTPLSVAALLGRTECVKQLLTANANVNVQNWSKQTPLLIAVKENHYKIVEILIQYGADIDAKDQSGHSALMYSAEYAHNKCLHYLLKSNATVDLLNDEGKTALELLAESIASIVDERSLESMIYDIPVEHHYNILKAVKLLLIARARVKHIKKLADFMAYLEKLAQSAQKFYHVKHHSLVPFASQCLNLLYSNDVNSSKKILRAK